MYISFFWGKGGLVRGGTGNEYKGGYEGSTMEDVEVGQGYEG